MKDLRTEEEIISSWAGEVERPVVSICCATYNQEGYIEDAIQGFLCQETDFPIEILIHDDASTDRTVAIISEYCSRYPKLIKPMFQSENQYSKGIKINPAFNFPRVKGEFIAMCEGDDYWMDPLKLKFQYQACKSDHEVSVVFHSAYEFNVISGEQKIVCDHLHSEGYVNTKDSVKGRGAFMPTASLFFRRKYIDGRLSWFSNDWPLGDFFIQMILSYSGKIYYLDRPMCVYRRNSIGSWTESQRNQENRAKYFKEMASAILDMRKLLVKSDGIDYLVHPYFFYTTSAYFDKRHLVQSFFRILTLTPFRASSVRFSALYLYLVFKLPFSFVHKKSGTK